jgi:hypothetical protein
VQRLVVRVWLADRPGALGQLASAIGSVGADVLSIDILEQGAGRAIDEIIVALPESVDLDQLVAAMQSVEAVAVEDVRPYAAAVRDHRTVALETAVGVVGADGFAAAAERLVVGVAGDLIADWVVVMGPDGVRRRGQAGRAGVGGRGCGDGAPRRHRLRHRGGPQRSPVAGSRARGTGAARGHLCDPPLTGVSWISRGASLRAGG